MSALLKQTTSNAPAPASCCRPRQTDTPVFFGGTATDSGTVHHIILPITGMHCGSCAEKVSRALRDIDGVFQVQVDHRQSGARISYDPQRTRPQTLQAAVTDAGYGIITPNKAQSGRITATQTGLIPGQWRRPAVFGILAAAGIIGFYLGLLTLTSDWFNARAQFGDYRWWIIALSAGLGTQVALFSRLRGAAGSAGIKGATSSVAASGGMSTVAMALCCSHYVATFLPTIGLPFLSAAAAGLAEYQVAFFALGVLSNLAGIAVVLRLLVKKGVIEINARLTPAT